MKKAKPNNFVVAHVGSEILWDARIDTNDCGGDEEIFEDSIAAALENLLSEHDSDFVDRVREWINIQEMKSHGMI